MSRHESPREDLLREATALVERAELVVAGYDEPITAGFRKDGSASFFFGVDPVYQFNAAGELRRAYVGGRLVKAEQGRLVALRRERSATEVALVREELSAPQTEQLLAAMSEHLLRLRTALGQDAFECRGQVPAEADVPSRIGDWLAALPPRVAVAGRPNVG
ncbi:MAG: hypothetical protein WD872_06985 [Pirellulaceae bacterium]